MLLLLYLCLLSIVLAIDLTTPIVDIEPPIPVSPSLTLIIDPPSGFFSPSALGVYIRASLPGAKIYYEVDSAVPTYNSPYLTRDTPYIQLNTPFGYGRQRNITVVAINVDGYGETRSEQYRLSYYVEGSSRPSAFGFLVPGVESGGIFIGVGIEMNATARSQSTGSNAAIGGQEFADFFAHLGSGPYNNQVRPLPLRDIDPTLTGFEGGFAG